MNRAIKYRLYPTTEQETLFAKTFGCCRKVWNLMLADKVKHYEETKSFGAQTPAAYKEAYPYLKEVDSLALANVQMNLQAAFRSCFDKKRKRRNNFPKFKSKRKSKKSYTTNNQKGSISIVKGGIKLPKIGVVKAVLHRMPEADWILKSATISQMSDGNYYISVLFEYAEQKNTYEADLTNAIGLDYSSAHLYIDDKGNIGSNHKYFKESQKKLAKAQRILSRRKGAKKGEEKSANYLKQERKVNKIYRHCANQRLDNSHKKSTEIANQYDVVCVEDLDMKALSNKKFGNGKTTMDNGYSMFLSMLSYKLAERNKFFVKVDKWYPSSQICSTCGTQNKEVKDLSIREWTCSVCGEQHNRDRNAALNIKKEGLRLLTEIKAA